MRTNKELLEEIDDLKSELSYFKTQYNSIRDHFIRTTFSKDEHHEMALTEQKLRILKSKF